MSRAMILLILLIVVIYVSLGTAMVFELERVHPCLTNLTVGKAVHLARDKARHARLFRSRIGTTSSGAANFDVWTDMDSYGPGLYYTRVRLGTPPREYSVLIDTGSDLLWISCGSCRTCPRVSSLVAELNFFDVANSTTSHQILCSDPECLKPSDCSQISHECGYSLHFRDGSGTSGSYVSDFLYLHTIFPNTTAADLSASVIFGCTTDRVGGLARPDFALDGIFGFDQKQTSVISQLASRGITPWSFSHCLKGADNGEGILALGEILDPTIVYTPLVPSRAHYDVNLLSISINGHVLPIDQAVFAMSYDRGAVIDSGSTFAYLPEQAYDSFVSAMNVAVSQAPIMSEGDPCYTVSTNLNDFFPNVSLNFAGGASMVLSPEEYLRPSAFPAQQAGALIWCIAFQKSEDGLTVLGDLVLKDKIVVYDIGRQRIGWTNYDCSLPVNVSVTLPTLGNTPQHSFGSSNKRFLFEALIVQTLFLLVDQLLMVRF